MSWKSVIDEVEKQVESYAIPALSVLKPLGEKDVLPIDPSNLSGKELADRLFEYSGYVSFLDAELGRIESETVAIEEYLSDVINAISFQTKLSKAKSRSQLIRSDLDAQKGAVRLTELKALTARMQGLRDGFTVRMNAVSREITRRGQEQ